MSKPFPDALRIPITDIASGKAWLKALVLADLAFHLEDDPEDIVTTRSDEPIFDPADVPLIRERVAALYAMEWGPRFECPIGYMIHIDQMCCMDDDPAVEERRLAILDQAEAMGVPAFLTPLWRETYADD